LYIITRRIDTAIYDPEDKVQEDPRRWFTPKVDAISTSAHVEMYTVLSVPAIEHGISSSLPLLW
jgi:hypothetical protein